ncbi:MAG: hypothetical protein WCS77_09970 [Elusimicrobiaceae bacterium]
MKRIAVLAFAAFFSASVFALRSPDSTVEAESVWMKIVSKAGSARETYIEADKDGKVLLRESVSGKIVTRKGGIKKQLVKDLFQEMKNEDVFGSAFDNKGRLLFYKGEMLQITSVWEGEVRNAEMPVEKLGQGFQLALDGVDEAAGKLPATNDVYRFVSAAPIAEDAADLEAVSKYGGESHRYQYVETSLIDGNVELSQAIARPYRLIPLASKQDTDKLYDFLYGNKVKNVSGDFMLSTSRGDFKISISRAQY